MEKVKWNAELFLHDGTVPQKRLAERKLTLGSKAKDVERKQKRRAHQKKGAQQSFLDQRSLFTVAFPFLYFKQWFN